MKVYEKLRALSTFAREHFGFFGTIEDHHLIGEIGHHQGTGKPLTLKQLFLLDVGSIATVQRRLRRLKELGLVQHRRSASDRRAVELTLTPKCVRMLAKYDALMTSTRSPQQVGEDGGPSHVCGLGDSDGGIRGLLVSHLVEGLKHGDRCILIAPEATQARVLGEVNHRRKTPAPITVTEGAASADAQVAFLTRALQDARQAGKRLRLAADMTWAFSRNLRFEGVLDIESRFDAMAVQSSVCGLCVYDTRSFSSGQVLRAMKCHRDHQRHPAVLA